MFIQPANLATNAKAVFTCLLDQVSCQYIVTLCRYMVVYHILGSNHFMMQIRQYTTEGLEKVRDGLKEAASHRERFVLGRKAAAGAVSAVILLY